jgi:hypothetical protein
VIPNQSQNGSKDHEQSTNRVLGHRESHETNIRCENKQKRSKPKTTSSNCCRSLSAPETLLPVALILHAFGFFKLASVFVSAALRPRVLRKKKRRRACVLLVASRRDMKFRALLLYLSISCLLLGTSQAVLHSDDLRFLQDLFRYRILPAFSLSYSSENNGTCGYQIRDMSCCTRM